MVPLAAATRSGFVESVHNGFICVVDEKGTVLFHKGDYHTRIFFRSSAKPVQVLPFVHSGAFRAMGFSMQEIAIACASHSGEKEHQETVRGILRRLHLEESSLHCGVMSPYSEKEQSRLAKEGEEPSVLHASCSGKHAAMIALSQFRGYNISHYEDPRHPVQQEILHAVAEFAEEEAGSIPVGVDGCGVPIYLLPVRKIALCYAKLAAYSQYHGKPYHEACKTVFDAMNMYPEMVAGKGEFDTELIRATKGKLIGKVGAEAVYCLAIKNGNLGVCIKIADGGERAVYPVVIQLLLDLNVLDGSEYEALKRWHARELVNNLKEHIGDIFPVFQYNGPVGIGDLLKPLKPL